MHQYFDGAGGTTVCNPVWNVQGKLGPVTTWARTNKAYDRRSSPASPSHICAPHVATRSKIFLGEFGLNDSDQCLALLETLMTFLKVRTC